MIRKADIPKFNSETEEAEWWDQHQAETAQWMEEAILTGQTTTLEEVVQRAKTANRECPNLSDEEPDDMPAEVDFSSGERGKYYQPGMRMSLPVRLTFNEDTMKFLTLKAQSKGVSLGELISDLLEKEIAVFQTVG